MPSGDFWTFFIEVSLDLNYIKDQLDLDTLSTNVQSMNFILYIRGHTYMTSPRGGGGGPNVDVVRVVA